jgi:hypothetical protein
MNDKLKKILKEGCVTQSINPNIQSKTSIISHAQTARTCDNILSIFLSGFGGESCRRADVRIWPAHFMPAYALHENQDECWECHQIYLMCINFQLGHTELLPPLVVLYTEIRTSRRVTTDKVASYTVMVAGKLNRTLLLKNLSDVCEYVCR